LDLRVFVVEDHPRIHALLDDLFHSVGKLRIAGTARSEAEAFLWLDEHPTGWDLCIIDLILSEGSGMGVIQRCKAAHPAGRVVVFSSYSTPAVRAHCIKLGAEEVFHKGDPKRFTEYCAMLAAQAPP
jgi:DNA-binding NarL/FixJ family response regulator